MDNKEFLWDGVECVHHAEDRHRYQITVNTTINLCVLQAVKYDPTSWGPTIISRHKHCSMEHTSLNVWSIFVPFHLSLLTVRHEHSQHAVTINLAMAPPVINDLVPFPSCVNPFHLTLLLCKFSRCLKLHFGSASLSRNFSLYFRLGSQLKS